MNEINLGIYTREIEWRVDIFRRRHGEGQLLLIAAKEHANVSVEVDFELIQFQDGGIYAYGKLKDDGSHENPSKFMLRYEEPSDETELRLVGQHDGLEIEVTDLLLTGTRMEGGFDKETEVFFRIHATHVQETRTFKNEGESEFRFHLSNLQLPALPQLKTQTTGGYKRTGEILECELAGNTVWLQSISKENQFERLEITNGIEVTATVSIFCNEDERENAVDKIGRLCQLLTFIQGTRVNWLAYDLLSLDDEQLILASWWQDAVTRQFGGATLINRLIARSYKMRVGHKTYKNWIEHLFPKFLKASEEWKISALINAYLDAADGGDFLELRGLKICGCLEILREHYLNSEEKTHLIDPQKWNAVVPHLQDGALNLLRELLPAEDDALLSRMTNHFVGMNYYPFRKALTELCQQVGYEVNGRKKLTRDAIGAFLSIRNGLVHRGEFAIPSEPGSTWDAEEIRRVRWAQYQFIERFSGGLLAALIGWNDAQNKDELKIRMPVAPRIWENH